MKKKLRLTTLFVTMFMLATFMVMADAPKDPFLEVSPANEMEPIEPIDGPINGLVGTQSLESNGRAIFGYWAGNNYTTANYFAFFGTYAGLNTTTGSYNTFIGDKAGYFNTSGHNNTYIGSTAGLASTTAYYNTFVGSSAGYNNTASFNAFFGERTGTNNTTGNYNTFLGTECGFYNETGYYNTFVGNLAGSDNVTGYRNTYIGMYAGANNTTGYGNVCLGYQAGVLETGSNKLYIGNSSTPLIYGDFSTDFVKINGYLGIYVNPSYPVHLSNGAYCSTGGTWTNASSREFKENIETLNTDEAVDALSKLNPVKYNYKADKADKHVGFIAEEAPELVVSADRKGMSPMDVVAVLTKVVQDLKKENRQQQEIISGLQERLTKLEKEKN